MNRSGPNAARLRLSFFRNETRRSARPSGAGFGKRDPGKHWQVGLWRTCALVLIVWLFTFWFANSRMMDLAGCGHGVCGIIRARCNSRYKLLFATYEWRRGLATLILA